MLQKPISRTSISDHDKDEFFSKQAPQLLPLIRGALGSCWQRFVKFWETFPGSWIEYEFLFWVERCRNGQKLGFQASSSRLCWINTSLLLSDEGKSQWVGQHGFNSCQMLKLYCLITILCGTLPRARTQASLSLADSSNSGLGPLFVLEIRV